MKLTIERMRTLVLAAAVLLIVLLAIFLVKSKWRNPFNPKDIPHKLGVDIQQEANGVTYTQSRGGRTFFKIHASKLVQMKEGTAILHDVKIELYGVDGTRVDRIEGGEFEYNQKEQIARATGPVEIFLMRPGEKLAVAPNAPSATSATQGKSLAAITQTAESGQIHVKTSGLTFDQKTGIATTSQLVNFSIVQGSGSSIGASYDSDRGLLILDHSVELNTSRNGDTVSLHAEHAEFTRDEQTCRLHAATLNYKAGQATAGDAKVLFREDGTAESLDSSNGFTLITSTGGHISAPSGFLKFDDHNQPHQGHMQNGVVFDSVMQSAGINRSMHGTSPTADLSFAPQGQLSAIYLATGVELQSEQQGPVKLTRIWHSPQMVMNFNSTGDSQVELASIHGSGGGVVVTSQSQSATGVLTPSRLTADDVTGTFGPRNVLSAITGTGHAAMEQTTPSGVHQTTTGDRLEAHFIPAQASHKNNASTGDSQIQNASLDGHVVLTQQKPAKVATPAPFRATAGHAQYESQGQWLHLTQNPRVDNGAMQLTGDKIDISQDSGDAFAHGNVKATWQDADHSTSGATPVSLGGKGPAHVVANEAQLHQSTDEATFRGRARLWQQANSIAAPVIVLNHQKQTLIASTTNPGDPVRAVLVSSRKQQAAPSVAQLTGGDLRYSDAEHKVILHGGVLRNVTAQTATATSVSNDLEVILLPPGNHAGKNEEAAQIDRMTATGHVVLTSQGRRGTGEKLVYTSDTGEYVLTGTPAVPPRMTDPVRGTVTGEAVIFHSTDDSISVEGRGQKTRTDTVSPK